MIESNISVVIPTHGGRFLSAAIASVRAQTIGDWELVIVDDGSADGTAQVAARAAAEDSRVRVVTNPRNAGIAAARNRGLSAISPHSEFVAFLDHDDVWMPETLEMLRTELIARPTASAAHGTVIGIDHLGRTIFFPPERASKRMGVTRNGLVEWPRKRPTEFANLAYEDYIVSTGAGLIRRTALATLRGFDLRAEPGRTITTSGSGSRAGARSDSSIARCWPTEATRTKPHHDRHRPAGAVHRTFDTRRSPRPTIRRNNGAWRSPDSGRAKSGCFASACQVFAPTGRAGTITRSLDTCSISGHAWRPF